MLRSWMVSMVAAATIGAACPAAAAATPPAPPPVPAGTYTLDKSHASLVFRVDHLGFSNYTGRFTRFDATLQFDPKRPTSLKLEATVDPASLDVDNPPPGFVEALRGAEWLDAGRFSKMTFRSTRVVSRRDGTLAVHGDFTLHGVTQPVVLTGRYNGGYAGHPMDPNARFGFSATGSLLRSRFGIAYGIPEPGSRMGVGDRVTFAIEAEFTGPPLPGVAPAAPAAAASR